MDAFDPVVKGKWCERWLFEGWYLPPCDCADSSSSTQWDWHSRSCQGGFEMLGSDMTVSDKPELVTFWGSHATSRTMWFTFNDTWHCFLIDFSNSPAWEWRCRRHCGAWLGDLPTWSSSPADWWSTWKWTGAWEHELRVHQDLVVA